VNTPPSNKRLIIVGGPTASGKTSLGIQIAQRFKTEILSADSRQFYKELNIGVAKPSEDELNTIPHHFVGHKSIHDYYSAGEFERNALDKLNTLFQIHDNVVMVGGSGLFINAVLHGFHEVPKDDGSVRQEIEGLFKTGGIDALVSRLEEIDPDQVLRIDKSNAQRLMRAIERVQITGKTHSAQTKPKRADRPFTVIEIAIDHPRQELYNRINQRVDVMMDSGLLKEVESLLPFKHLNALQTVGYSELFAYLGGVMTLDEATNKIKQNTRRYAKRQMTWFRNKSETVWFRPNELNNVIDYIEANRH
jgi:tRNA dimethylallyltransferase